DSPALKRAARGAVAARVQRMSGAGGEVVTGVLHALESPLMGDAAWRAEVDVYGGGHLWLPANPGGYNAPPSGVYVQVDSGGRPYHVLGPTGMELPDSVATDAEPVVVQPDLSIDEEARRRNEEVAGELEAAEGRITSAQD